MADTPAPEIPGGRARSPKLVPVAALVVVLLVALLVFISRQGSAPSASSKTVLPSSTVKPLLIEHGFDSSTAADVAKNAARIDTLPFDGIAVNPKQSPCSVAPVSDATAQADMATMPKLTKVVHNFLLCRIEDPAPTGGLTPYDVNNDATWTALSSNLAVYAKAAQATGMFDGIIIDTEYYGKGPNPWDYDTIAIPLTYGPARPWSLSPEAQAKSQSRGKQITKAMIDAWPNVVLLSFRGAYLSDKASYLSANMGGNDVAWANELAGPFFIGMVEGAAGTQAVLVDGGESYYQRTVSDFQKSYSWRKVGIADSKGPMVPSGAVTAAMYKSTVTVASQLLDRDIGDTSTVFSAKEVQDQITNAGKGTDRYVWLFSELYDWRGTGFPAKPVPSDLISAVTATR